MADKHVIGIYLERSGGTLIRANVMEGIRNGRWRPIIPLDHVSLEWAPDNIASAKEGIGRMISLIDEVKDNLDGVSIACYGPFVSLSAQSDEYAQLDHRVADLPFRGQNLLQLILGHLDNNRSVCASVHTDANALALGEAYARELPRDELLTSILVTEEIGLGVVSRQAIQTSALHSELGLLQVAYDENDPLRPDRPQRQYQGSLSSLASNKALRERYRRLYRVRQATDADILRATEDRFWDLRAYYLAQGALACAVMLAPHQIVVASDVDPNNTLIESLRLKFKLFLSDRNQGKAPVFSYDKIKDLNKYISVPTPILGNKYPSIRSTGALGMCVAAGKLERGEPLGQLVQYTRR